MTELEYKQRLTGVAAQLLAAMASRVRHDDTWMPSEHQWLCMRETALEQARELLNACAA